MALLSCKLLEGLGNREAAERLGDRTILLSSAATLVSVTAHSAIRKIKDAEPIDLTGYDPIVLQIFDKAVVVQPGQQIRAQRPRKKREPRDASLVKLRSPYQDHLDNPLDLTREEVETLWCRLCLGWDADATARELYPQIGNLKSATESMSRRLHRSIARIKNAPPADLTGYNEKIRSVWKAALDFKGGEVSSAERRAGRKPKPRRKTAPAKPRMVEEEVQQPISTVPEPPHQITTDDTLVEEEKEPTTEDLAEIERGEVGGDLPPVKKRPATSPEKPAERFVLEEEPADDGYVESRFRKAQQELEQQIDSVAGGLSRPASGQRRRSSAFQIRQRALTNHSYTHPWKELTSEDLLILWEHYVHKKSPLETAREFYQERDPKAVAGWIDNRLEQALEIIRPTLETVTSATWPGNPTTLVACINQTLSRQGGDKPLSGGVGSLVGKVQPGDGEQPAAAPTKRPPSTACPKCGGPMVDGEDWYGSYRSCVTCGYVDEPNRHNAAALVRAEGKHQKKPRTASHYRETI